MKKRDPREPVDVPFAVVDDGTGKPARWFGSWRGVACLAVVIGARALWLRHAQHAWPFP